MGRSEMRNIQLNTNALTGISIYRGVDKIITVRSQQTKKHTLYTCVENK